MNPWSVSPDRLGRALRLITALLPAACATPGTAPSPSTAPAASILSQIRQLTFAGRRSGEGYFSRDGSKIVFQSEREPGNPFYQIYLMDLTSGDVRRLSPGTGKTTCAWLHPGDSRALFASTHRDPEALAKQQREIQLRAEGAERRYAWDYDEHFDLYVADLAGGEPRPLLPARGYDAEGSWSPDGRQVVFASNRHAYAGTLSESDRERRDRDPSAFVELYIADARGGGLRRLTDSPGYDGGPFFSPDGRRIVWRRFSPDGAHAEIYSMNTDGSDVVQVTDLGAMAWAPFYHPSGDYIVFTANLEGFSNFELYLVDAAGAHTPVRVSHSPGFDGLPVFSPDGRTLSWTSGRGAGGRSQIFLADWNDALARGRLGLPETGSQGVAPLLPLPERTRPEIDTGDLRAHVEALASDVTEGRLTGSPGERIATGYVARMFRRIGLQPAGDNGSYFQEFGFTAGMSLGDANRLWTPGSESAFAVDRDWRPLAFSETGEFASAEVVFAGYGIVAPADGDLPALDDYAGLDVADRWVLIFRYAPERLRGEARRRLRRYSSLRHKAMLARERGARGILVVSGPTSKVEGELVELSFDVSLAGSGIAALSIRDALAAQWLRAAGRELGALQAGLDGGEATPGFSLPGVRLAANIELRQQRRKGRNVIGRLRLAEHAGGPFVLMGAHVDHLGRGVGPNSLARNAGPDAIHYGADDNASGVAAVLEAAEALADARARGALTGGRDLVFAAWSGEEIGLLGSTHYAESLADPANPHADLHARVVAYLNLDMVGRLDDALTLFGAGSSAVWPAAIERSNAPIGLPIAVRDESYLPTDATPFFIAGVPILSAFTGAHPDYHTPRDTAQKIHYAGLRDTARLAERLARDLSLRAEMPDYVASPRPEHAAPRAGLRVYLGSIPDYAHTEVDGVRLAGVTAGGPAEAGGLRAGDVVVEVAGRRIANIYDYTFALGDLSVGEAVTVRVLRAGQPIALQVTPGSRD